MAFFQPPPDLKNQFDSDALLLEYLARQAPEDILADWRDELRHLGELSAGPLFRAQQEDRLKEPTLTSWDPWGRRIDSVEVSPLWRRAAGLAAEHGLVATAYEGRYGALDRVFQFTKNYLVQASLDVHSCPLAMTDGAARTLLACENQQLIDRAVPHLTSRNASQMWTSGQWMTERTGGSDVGLSETEARPLHGDVYSLHGTKWFTSAVTADMALTLARPVDNPPEGRGLALFYLELRDNHGQLNGIQVNRLKDKLGTRKVPTAELTLDGCQAIAVKGTTHGTRHISAMLNVTRTWNAVAAAWGARRGLALARDYAKRRVAFGRALSEQPLHVDTLASMASDTEAIFHLAFRTVELLGRVEHKEADAQEQALLRVLTPIAKLTTAKQAVAVASETLEAFGGAGYIEDTGLPVLLRDAQVLPIWEGTTNVLSLDTLRALRDPDCGAAVAAEIRRAMANVQDPSLQSCVFAITQASDRAQAWLLGARGSVETAQAGARRYALTLGRILQLSYLCQHAQWCIDQNRGRRAAAAARRFASHGINLINSTLDPDDSAILTEG
ncbi:MAG: acyl-CoA dehydrogenase family protein [Myxococcota bacterium]